MLNRPKFIDSDYFYIDEDGWHLEPNAPKELKEEFNEFMKSINSEPDESGIITQY